MQACARIGAIHSVVFGGFSAKSVNERIIDAGARARHHGRRPVPRRQGNRAQARGRRGAGDGRLRSDRERRRLPAHRRPGRLGRQARPLVARPRHRPAARLRARRRSTPSTRCSSSTPPAPPASPRASSTPPAATCCGADLLDEVDLRHQGLDDVFWCTADVGWITGHTYVAYGPLAGRRDARSCSRACRPTRSRGALLGDDPAAQGHDLLHRADRDPLADQGSAATCPKQYDLSSLRLLGTVGEPINPEAWMWYYTHVGGVALPDRRHLVADRDRQPHDLAAARRDAAEARLLHVAAARHPGGDRRRDRPRRRMGQGRLPGHQAALAVDDPHDLGRPGPLSGSRTTRTISAASSTSRATARTATSTATSGSWAASTTC